MMLLAVLVLGLSTPNVGYTLTVPPKVSLSGPPPQFQLAIQNQGKETVRIIRSWFWVNHRATLLDESGRPVELTEEGKRRASSFGSASRYRNIVVGLKPESTMTDAVDDFRPNYKLSPGTYWLRFEYRDEGPLIQVREGVVRAGPEVRLSSNEVSFEVVR